MFDTRRVGQDFSNAASHYDLQTPLQKHVLSQLLGKALPLLKQHARLLDAGCGTGRLARQCPRHQVIQLDIAYAMCRQAAMPTAPVVVGTVESLPFVGAAFDGVFSSLALQWVNDQALAIKEMQRVLKRDGILAISTFGPGTLKELKESFAAVDTYPHVSEFTPQAGFAAREEVVEYYPDMFVLMNHLKAIGARNKLLKRRKSLMTRGQMQQVERRYRERFATISGLPVTWEILYLVERKP